MIQDPPTPQEKLLAAIRTGDDVTIQAAIDEYRTAVYEAILNDALAYLYDDHPGWFDREDEESLVQALNAVWRPVKDIP
jgi:hypothetical protein